MASKNPTVTKLSDSEVASKGFKSKHEFKVLLFGDQDVGKTSLQNRFASGEFQETPDSSVRSYGATEIVQHLEVDGDLVRMTLVDTGRGLSRFGNIDDSFIFARMDSAILVYDITDRETFESACSYWLREVERYVSNSSDTLLMLVGNKCDLNDQRAVTEAEAYEYATLRYDALFVETSAKDGTNVMKAFDDLIIEWHKRNCKPPATVNRRRRSRCTCFPRCIIL